MIARNYVKDQNTEKDVIVWFGSYGKNLDGTAKKAVNYKDEVDGLISNLNQELSVLEGELWYNIYQGLPLIENYKSKSIFDSYIIQLLNNYDEVTSIKSFSSALDQNDYKCDIVINTIYGDLNIVL